MVTSLEAAETAELRADICIIGTGPSGQAVARALAGSELDVLMLEAGDLEAGRWGRRFASTATPTPGRQYPDAGHQVVVRVGGTSDRWAVRLRPGPPDAEQPGLRLCRLGEVDLADRPALGLAGWPIGLADLEPHYDAAERLFGIGPCAGIDDPGLPEITEDVVAESVWAAPSRPVLRPAPGTARVVYQAPVRTVVPGPDGRIERAVAVTRSGREVDVFADVFVLALGTIQTTRLLLDSPWSPAGTVANSSGLVGTHLSDHPQLFIGQVALRRPGVDLDPILGLAPVSHDGPIGPILRWPNLLTAPTRAATGEVTRMAATLLAAERLPHAQRFRNRIPRPLGGRTGGVAAAAALQDAVVARSLRPRDRRHLLPLLRGLDEVAFEALGSRLRPRSSPRPEDPHWGHLVGGPLLGGFHIFAIAEQLPDPGNRIVLTDRTNQIGAHVPLVDWRWSSEDARLAENAADDIRTALARLGVGDVLARRGRAAIRKISSHHAAGTTRMSTSPADGVVDPDLRTHDHPNLYVVGSSVFRSMGHITPTLTDLALGLRLGAHLREI